MSKQLIQRFQKKMKYITIFPDFDEYKRSMSADLRAATCQHFCAL